MVNHRISRAPCAVPAAVLWVALSNSLLQLHVEECQLLPALLLQNFVKDGCVEIIHSIPSLQQEVVSHGLQVPKKPKIKKKKRGLGINVLQNYIMRFMHKGFSCRISPVVFLQGSHEVPTAFNVSPLNMWIQTGTERKLKRLTCHRLGGAVQNDTAAREFLVEVILL